MDMWLLCQKVAMREMGISKTRLLYMDKFGDAAS